MTEESPEIRVPVRARRRGFGADATPGKERERKKKSVGETEERKNKATGLITSSGVTETPFLETRDEVGPLAGLLACSLAAATCLHAHARSEIEVKRTFART